MECNIDDMNPEIYAYVMDKLFLIGASDVYLTNIMMKKGRPAVKLTVLCPCSLEEKIKEVLFTETSTLGIRKYLVEKSMLQRKFDEVNTIYGKIRVKKSYYKDKLVKSKLEYEDCKSIAKDNNIPLLKVYKDIDDKSKM